MAPRESAPPVDITHSGQSAMCPATLHNLTKEELVWMIMHTNRRIVKVKKASKLKDQLIQVLHGNAGVMNMKRL